MLYSAPSMPPTFPRPPVKRAVPALLLLLALLPASAASAAPNDDIDWAKEQQFWSFRPPVAPARPVVKDQASSRQPLDRFVLARLEQKGLAPSPEAAKGVLIRRLSFDLTGLPPEPKEVEAFLADDRPDAYERLVGRLLNSPAFGEHMASLWLPLARYAEDQAHQVGNDTQFFYPHAYKYRQWVIDAFNRDLPYDRFITLQLAADQVAGQADKSEAKGNSDGKPTVSPDLPALGFLGLGPKYYNRGRLDVQASEWDDRVDTVTRTFLGLTVACARCHDHKFDPITQADYYALAGVFADTSLVNKTPDGKTVDPKLTGDKMPADTMHVVEDVPANSLKDLNVFLRGNVERKGPLAPRRFPRILCQGEPTPFKAGSGRRELAAAIASSSNPLTARVMVNRVWGMLTGKPIVPTPSNFGHSGMPATNPQLLDDLAVRFTAPADSSGPASDRPGMGWSVKQLVHEIVTSATYRQCSDEDPAKVATDPSDDLMWRMNRRRLTVEQWRDATLFVAGTLQPSPTGNAGLSMELDDAKNLRRTVFARVSRLKLNEMLMQFDYPDANVHSEQRAVTTSPMQKLFMLNGAFILSQSKALAARLTSDPSEPDASRVARAYRLLLSREPDAEETQLALAFLSRPTSASTSRWEQYVQVLLASNEMLYVD